MEAAARIRKLKRLSQHQAIDKPLIVVLTKSDVWKKLIEATPTDIWAAANGEITKFARIVEKVSRRLRQILVENCPEVITAAESLSKSVVFTPISALGITPTVDPTNGKPSIDPAAIAPRWVTVPLVYALTRLPWDPAKFYSDNPIPK
jgi:hypothetical protein